LRSSSKNVLIIVPTHSNAATLPNALESIRSQSLAAFTVAILADGANAACLETADSFCKSDSRFNLISRQKSVRRGEEMRHEVILSTGCKFVTYLADDDLFLPNHIESMIAELESGYDFVNPFPAFVNRKDQIWSMPTAIQLKSNKTWHLSETPQNSISLSGAMHTLESYLALEKGWETTPDDFPWTDLFMWQKFMRNSDLKMKTSSMSTIIKFLGGSNIFDLEKIEQNHRWAKTISNPDWASEWQSQVEAHRLEKLAEWFVIDPPALLAKSHDLKRQLSELESERNALEKTIWGIKNSKSWRWTATFRNLFGWLQDKKERLRDLSRRST
jgi:glycosyltransferase involved in cell wall biosynthesis